MTETQKPEPYRHHHLTQDEVKNKVLEQLRNAEMSHITADVNAELNRQNAALLVEEAKKPVASGGKIDMGMMQQANVLNQQVKKLNREMVAHERAIKALEERYGSILDLPTEEDLGQLTLS